jgi:hypothetical protein
MYVELSVSLSFSGPRFSGEPGIELCGVFTLFRYSTEVMTPWDEPDWILLIAKELLIQPSPW